MLEQQQTDLLGVNSLLDRRVLLAVMQTLQSVPIVMCLQAIRDALSRLDEMSATELGEQLNKYGVKAPETANAISKPFPFNLMFRTSIGPRGDSIGYLRPETAQGIFVNFRQGAQALDA